MQKVFIKTMTSRILKKRKLLLKLDSAIQEFEINSIVLIRKLHVTICTTKVIIT